MQTSVLLPIPPRAGCLLQYQISLIVVSNPQKLTALRSATHSTCDSGPMLAPSHSLGSLFHCLQISGQSLEAIAFIVSNPLVGFQHLHACGMQIHWRHGRLHTPIVGSSTTDTSFTLSTLFPTSGRIDHTKSALDSTQLKRWTIWCPTSPT